ncbi:MAG: zinc-binding dehydrogenase [Chloroflexi bacterium]|nr:zinc-binding dehydrogenase [Chloroflexota bacterium]
MAETGRIAVFMGPHRDFELREFPVPDVEPGAILIKISAANVCGSDLHFWRGDMGKGREVPGGSLMGHEMTGRVARLGQGVTTDSLGRPLREGDRVAYAYFYPCRKCAICATGDLYCCPYRQAGAGPLGEPPYFTSAFADYYYLKPNHFVFQVPGELSDAMVAPVNCAFSQVAFGLVKADVKFGETVVIQGAGGLGLYATAVARERGASKVIAIDGQKARLELARRMGADETVDMADYPTAEARIERVRELTGGLGADLTVGLVGFAAAFPEALQMLRSGGRHLEIGSISQVDTVSIAPAMIVSRRITVIGVGVYDPWIIPKVLDFMVRTKDRYPYHEIVSNSYPLAEISRAFREAEWKSESGEQSAVTRALLVP